MGLANIRTALVLVVSLTSSLSSHEDVCYKPLWYTIDLIFCRLLPASMSINNRNGMFHVITWKIERFLPLPLWSFWAWTTELLVETHNNTGEKNKGVLFTFGVIWKGIIENECWVVLFFMFLWVQYNPKDRHSHYLLFRNSHTLHINLSFNKKSLLTSKEQAFYEMGSGWGFH